MSYEWITQHVYRQKEKKRMNVRPLGDRLKLNIEKAYAMNESLGGFTWTNFALMFRL